MLSTATACIVVHHKRHSSIVQVLHGLIEAGLSPAQIVVIDNSEVSHPSGFSLDQIPLGVNWIETDNRGYGAAINVGRDELRRLGVETPFLLVATHEAEISRGSLKILQTELAESDFSAIGPTLYDSGSMGKSRIWSTGGRLTRFLKRPVHCLDFNDTNSSPSVIQRDWLDGALVLYKSDDLDSYPFDESFFLYMEEVDLHLRMGQAGLTLGVATKSVAYQSSLGTPAYYFARNIRLLSRKHSFGLAYLFRAFLPIIRRALSLVAHARWSELWKLFQGTFAPLPKPESKVVLINPLGVALKHYTSEVQDVLLGSSITSDLLTFKEPSAGPAGKITWLRNYLRACLLARSRKRGSSSVQVIVLWPVIGFLDSLILRLVIGDAKLIIHDPIPLVKASGYGTLAKRIGRILHPQIELLTHSTKAQVDLASSLMLPKSSLRTVPHPILRNPSETPKRPENTIRVLGQFKPDRDILMLNEFSKRCSETWHLEITGRGWPKVHGWKVDSRFVSEDEFDSLLKGSSVLLIPYRRFYQSGVAIRAIELGVPFVGPRDSVLADIVGAQSPWLTDESPSSWISASIAASEATSSQIEAIHADYLKTAIEGWEQLYGDPQSHNEKKS